MEAPSPLTEDEGAPMSTQGGQRRSPQIGSLQSQRIVTLQGHRENVAGPAAIGVQVATFSSRVDVSCVSEMPEETQRSHCTLHFWGVKLT